MENNTNDILLFKTNISTANDKNILQPTFDRHPLIKQWSVDVDDEDHVLRIISQGLDQNNIITMVSLHGYHCEELKD